MFFLKKKYNTWPDLSWIGADMHSHLVPGIDDGVPDMATALKLLQGFVSMGFKKVITTPHILWELYPNSRQTIEAGVQQVQQAAAEAQLNIKVKAAAEYFLDDYFKEQLQSRQPLLTIEGNKVLIEFSMIAAPFDLQECLFEMQLQNYQPVLAHPERYTYLGRKKEVYDELKNLGCLFQLNLLSLTGYYGATVQQIAEYLLRKDFYDLAGTDMHHEQHLSALKKLNKSSNLQRLKDSGRLQNPLLL